MKTEKHKQPRVGRSLTLELLRYFKANYDARPMHTIALKYGKGTIYRRVYEAERIGYLKKYADTYTITPKGNRLLNEDAIWELKIRKPKKWDYKLYLVLYDIPAKRKKHRDIFRFRLKELGLVLYQNSVWVYPYAVEDVVSKIAKFYFIDKYISYAKVESLTGREALLKQFGFS